MVYTGALALGEVVEAGAIVVLFGGAEWVEDRCLARARCVCTCPGLKLNSCISAYHGEHNALQPVLDLVDGSVWLTGLKTCMQAWGGHDTAYSKRSNVWQA